MPDTNPKDTPNDGESRLETLRRKKAEGETLTVNEENELERLEAEEETPAQPAGGEAPEQPAQPASGADNDR